MANSASRLLLLLARMSLCALAAVIPLTVFPWTVDPLEINKQTMGVFFVVVAVVAWLGTMLVQKRAELRLSWLFAPLGVFFITSCVSAALSLAPYSSVVGQGAQEYTSLLSLGVFLILFVVGTHVFADFRVQQGLWSALLVAFGVISLTVVFGLMGIDLVTPPNFIGTPNSLGLSLVTVTLLGSGLWLTSRDEGSRDMLPNGVWGWVVRLSIVVTAIAAFATLLAIDYWVLWVVALCGVAVLFVFALARAQEFPHPSKFVLPMLMFVVALLFLFLPTVFPNPFPAEISPTYAGTWEIVRQTFAHSSALFGSGPGTFVVDYTQYHGMEVNQTSFWDARFDRGASHIMTMLATYGLIPTVAFVVFVLSLGALVLTRLVRERNHEEWKLTFAPFVAWVMLVVAMALYSQNFTLAFLFWLVSAVLAAHVAGDLREYVFARSPRAGLVAAFCFVLMTVGMFTMVFVTGTRYRAEVAFARAVALDRQGGSLDEIILELDSAATANRWSDVYYRNLGNALLYKTGEVLRDETANPEYVKSLIAAAINAGVRSTELGPTNVANWELRGDIYREVAPIVGDADAYALASYEQAIALAPNNPKYYVGLARTYLVQVDLLKSLMNSDDEALVASANEEQQDLLMQAEQALIKATSLKGDYVQARYFMAFVQERQGKLDEAVRSMELVRTTSSSDVGVSLQLALLYLRNGESDSAKAELQRALNIAPNFANAHWYLSAILAQEGDIDGAIAELSAVLELNPEHETVKNRIVELEAGRIAETLPDPLESTVDSTVLPIEDQVVPQLP